MSRNWRRARWRERQIIQSQAFVASWNKRDDNVTPCDIAECTEPNALRRYFEQHREGPGIWKWRHYFDVYHRHLAKFVGRDVSIVEIGVYSGGSLGMWRHYFGASSTVHGVDIEAACKSYESEFIKVHIGDQSDREFWKQFRAEVPFVDIVIDDGGHQDHQQITTLEELLPHLRPGGVYICEDVHGQGSGFGTYAQCLADQLNAARIASATPEGQSISSLATKFQAEVDSVHFYPYVTVIERTKARVREFVAPKHGTHWQPFL